MKKTVLLIIKIVFIILIIISILGIISWLNDHNKVKEITIKTQDYLIEDNSSYQLKPSIKKINNDTIAWIKIDGTNINYPVVQTKNNDFYLNHDYNKKRNSAGWIFLDKRNTLNDQNLIIYGHHRKDKIMFGDIDKLFKENYYKNHEGIITLIVNKKTYKYKIFSVFKAKSDESYNDTEYEDLNNHIKEYQGKSIIKFKEKFKEPNQIITLSTCHNNNIDRLVVKGYII